MFGKIVPQDTPEQNRFTSISDFKWCMKCGGEVQFIWNGTTYCCFGKMLFVKLIGKIEADGKPRNQN